MNIQATIESLKFFTELGGIAMTYDLSIMRTITAKLERRHTPRQKNTGSGAAKKGPKNLLAAAASVQAVAA